MRTTAIFASLLVILALPAGAADWTVLVGRHAFDPTPITISMGDTIHWVWDCGGIMHSTTSDPNQAESWDSGVHPTGDKAHVFDHQFKHVGTFYYHSSAQEDMRGMVIVAPESSGIVGAGPRVDEISWTRFIEAVIRQMDVERRESPSTLPQVQPAPPSPSGLGYHMAGWG